jgi:hypothetical protein
MEAPDLDDHSTLQNRIARKKSSPASMAAAEGRRVGAKWAPARGGRRRPAFTATTKG